MAKSTWRLVSGYLGEYLREAGVLVIVFALLDRVVNDRAMTKRWVLVTLAVSLLGWSLGTWFSLKGESDE